jgi:hypothetical protein
VQKGIQYQPIRAVLDFINYILIIGFLDNEKQEPYTYE